jgi:hypothetical protein
MIEKLTRRDFEGLPVGALCIEHEGQRIPVSVDAARDLAPGSPRANSFALELLGPAVPVIPQGVHGLLHPTHGRLDLFVVPIGRTSEATRYELIFN